MKLYPPAIEGTIPAFYENRITVPFVMNKTVNKNSVGGFILLIKTAHSNKLLGSLSVNENPLSNPNWNLDIGWVKFDFNNDSNLFNKIKVGNYYKLQLAYIHSSGTIGYYSTVGVVKYTTKPSVIIGNLEDVELNTVELNMNQDSYVGVYSQEGQDITEKVYNYCFDIYDNDGNLYETSGKLLHNSFEDETAYYSRDIYTPKRSFLINKIYHIKYTVYTTNGLEVSSQKYRIIQKESIDPEIKAEIITVMDRENGYVKVSLQGAKDQYGVEQAVTGSLIIRRACSKDDYGEWDTVIKFKLNGQCPSRWVWKDFTVEQGYSYKYALQQFNEKGLYSNRIESDPVLASFEDAFLFDGKRQLKIKYNPKISSFKTNILQSKIDTIGGKYPFIFRNGSVSYKEFPISGLISYHMDEQFLFIDKEDLMIDFPETNLSDKNIASERVFKQEVLNWLNNGETKLFRSPTEGNFLVKLLNVSLSPNDTTGRMLHTFNCTAYETDDYNYETLLSKGFIEIASLDDTATRWETIQLPIIENGKILSRPKETELLHESQVPATSLKIEGVDPGTQFILSDGKTESIIAVGVTGTYNIDIGLGMEIYSLKTYSEKIYSGQISYSFKSKATNVFDFISDITIEDIPIKQFMGGKDILKEINNVKTNLSRFNFMHFQKRNVQTIYTNDEKHYYFDKELRKWINEENYKYDPNNIYLIIVIQQNTEIKKYADGHPNNRIDEYSNAFVLNGASIDLTEKETYFIKNPPEKIDSFILGNGLSLECAYQTRTKHYKFEEFYQEIIDAYTEYITTYNNYKELLHYGPEEILENDEYIEIINIDDSGYKFIQYKDNYFEELNSLYNNLYGKNITINGKSYDLYEYYIYKVTEYLAIEEENKGE